MRRIIVCGLVWLWCSAPAVAQGVAEELAAAQQKIDVKEWAAALELLLRLQETGASDQERERIASRLTEVGGGLQEGSAFEAALHAHAAALAMRKRLHGDGDHPDVATSLNNVAACLQSLGQAEKALPQCEAALAMHMRLHGDGDHPDVATSLNNVAFCLESSGQADKALPKFEAALAMWQRLDRDHPDVATGLNNVGWCLQSLGQAEEALPKFEAALMMWQRRYGDADHLDVATARNNMALCLQSLGQADKALPQYEAALAMERRLYNDRDHPFVASSLNNVGSCLESLGHADKALPQCEAALAMRRRLCGDRDHPDVAASLNIVALCLRSLGQWDKALTQYEAGLAMVRRIYRDRDHPYVATSLNNVATCLRRLGQVDKALQQYEAALTMRRGLYGDRDHPDVAWSLDSVALCLQSLGHADEALQQYEAALAMRRRLYGGRDHPDVATSLTHVALCLRSLGQADKALTQHHDALAMVRRLYGDRDHPHVANSLIDMAVCLRSLGQADKALPQCERACAMFERIREHSATSTELRQSLFDELKSGGAFELLQALAVPIRPGDALGAAERSRARDLLDMLEQHRADPLDEALRRARLRGDAAAAARVQELRQDLEATDLESDRLLHKLTRLDDSKRDEAERQARRQELIAQSDRAAQHQRQLLDERARLVADVLPIGRVRTAAEIQSALQDGELLLQFTVTGQASFVYVVAREGEVQALPLPMAAVTVRSALPLVLRSTSHDQLRDERGRDPEATRKPAAAADIASRELFESLIPKELWPRVRSARRVWIAAHRDLHRLPFELLVTDIAHDKPVHWLDSGPPITYVQSGSALCWLRQRGREASDDVTSIDLLAVGDPRMPDVEREVPEQGVFVAKVNEGGEGARVGLQARDVLVSYDGKMLADDAALRDLRTAADAAIEDGRRPKAPIPIEVWRRGETLKLEVNAGLLGIQVGRGRARMAYEASLGTDAQLERVTRGGDLERLAHLPPLRGARAETEAIAALFAEKGAKAHRLLDKDATEPAVFERAAKAKYLHFACHGIAEEYAGQSLSMLVLSQPQHVLSEDDGLLKLGDLLHHWRGRLASCRLVVLSACRTNVGPLHRDEAPQALPLGFLFAGAPAVISSLWAVDDASTRELMTDFYRRLLADEKDRLAAFTAAKRALRQKYPDPFHWAPFLYIGSPE